VAAAVVEAIEVPRNQPTVGHHGGLPIGLGLAAGDEPGDPGELGPQPILLGRQGALARIEGGTVEAPIDVEVAQPVALRGHGLRGALELGQLGLRIDPLGIKAEPGLLRLGIE
jgi:hypothetical protein